MLLLRIGFLPLQESLGGNARTSLVVAVADAIEHCDETLQSLQFGTRAMFVENTVRYCAQTANNRSTGVQLPQHQHLFEAAGGSPCPCATTQLHCRLVIDMAPQAVVNEKTDDAVTHQQLLLEMEEQAGRTDELSRSLIDKESALGSLERKLEVHGCLTPTLPRVDVAPMTANCCSMM